MTFPGLRSLAAGAALLGISIVLATATVAHETAAGQLHINVRGTASATPDMARLNAGVVAQAATASAAMAAQRERMLGVMAAIRKAGVAERDIQTSGINLSPLYTRGENRNAPPRITGYQASNQVNVIVRDLSKVGAGLDALVASGANNIGHVSFGFSDQASMIEKARADAIARLKERRDFYADVGELKIGRLISLSEGGSHQPPQPMMMMDRAESAKASTPIAPGESEVSVSLSATYEIKE